MKSVSRNTVEQGRATREALLRTAEAMIAEQGFDAVSLREIARAAGLGNNSAVRYHFGSKDALIQGIFEWRATQMEAPRARLIELAETDQALNDPRRLWEIIFLPYLGLREPGGDCPYAGFMLHYLTYKRPLGMQHFSETGNAVPNLQRVQGLIAAQLTHLHPHVADRRQYMAAMMFCSTLVNQSKRPVGNGREDPLTFLHDMLELLAGASVAPLPDNSASLAQRIDVALGKADPSSSN